MARALSAVYQEDRAIRVIGASLVLAVTGLGATSTTQQGQDHLTSAVIQEKSENAVLKREVKRLRRSNHDWHRYARKVEREKGQLLSLVAALRRKLHPPAPSLGGIPASIYRAFMCIHRGEGAWNANTGNGYYGGLQMDYGFMRTYGSEYLSRYGTADRWPPSVQIAVAYKAYRSGRGFGPWPNTARACGVL
jgi:hypothetical protein